MGLCCEGKLVTSGSLDSKEQKRTSFHYGNRVGVQPIVAAPNFKKRRGKLKNGEFCARAEKEEEKKLEGVETTEERES